MGGFEVVSGYGKDPKWYPVAYNSGQTLYVGQLVTLDTTNEGCITFATSSGTPDTDIPFGVVVGTNNRTPVYSSTYSSDSITGVATPTAQLAREWTGQEGVWSKGEPAPMVQVHLIDETTVLRGRIFDGAYGTALTAVSPTVWTSGASVTTASITFNNQTYGNTWHCLTGANAGLRRVDSAASATAHTFATYWPYTGSTTDTFNIVTTAIGRSKAKFVSGMFIDGNVDTAVAYHVVDILELDMDDLANTTCLFRFGKF